MLGQSKAMGHQSEDDQDSGSHYVPPPVTSDMMMMMSDDRESQERERVDEYSSVLTKPDNLLSDGEDVDIL